uniref:Uncharacterized protein n=1 Tax=Arundo donax TaxID=35708 RepID=A0A0A9I2M7_ARUDO
MQLAVARALVVGGHHGHVYQATTALSLVLARLFICNDKPRKHCTRSTKNYRVSDLQSCERGSKTNIWYSELG